MGIHPEGSVAIQVVRLSSFPLSRESRWPPVSTILYILSINVKTRLKLHPAHPENRLALESGNGIAFCYAAEDRLGFPQDRFAGALHRAGNTALFSRHSSTAGSLGRPRPPWLNRLPSALPVRFHPGWVVSPRGLSAYVSSRGTTLFGPTCCAVALPKSSAPG